MEGHARDLDRHHRWLTPTEGAQAGLGRSRSGLRARGRGAAMGGIGPGGSSALGRGRGRNREREQDHFVNKDGAAAAAAAAGGPGDDGGLHRGVADAAAPVRRRYMPLVLAARAPMGVSQSGALGSGRPGHVQWLAAHPGAGDGHGVPVAQRAVCVVPGGVQGSPSAAAPSRPSIGRVKMGFPRPQGTLRAVHAAEQRDESLMRAAKVRRVEERHTDAVCIALYVVGPRASAHRSGSGGSPAAVREVLESTPGRASMHAAAMPAEPTQAQTRSAGHTCDTAAGMTAASPKRFAMQAGSPELSAIPEVVSWLSQVCDRGLATIASLTAASAGHAQQAVLECTHKHPHGQAEAPAGKSACGQVPPSPAQQERTAAKPVQLVVYPQQAASPARSGLDSEHAAPVLAVPHTLVMPQASCSLHGIRPQGGPNHAMMEMPVPPPGAYHYVGQTQAHPLQVSPPAVQRGRRKKQEAPQRRNLQWKEQRPAGVYGEKWEGEEEHAKEEEEDKEVEEMDREEGQERVGQGQEQQEGRKLADMQSLASDQEQLPQHGQLQDQAAEQQEDQEVNGMDRHWQKQGSAAHAPLECVPDSLEDAPAAHAAQLHGTAIEVVGADISARTPSIAAGNLPLQDRQEQQQPEHPHQQEQMAFARTTYQDRRCTTMVGPGIGLEDARICPSVAAPAPLLVQGVRLGAASPLADQALLDAPLFAPGSQGLQLLQPLTQAPEGTPPLGQQAASPLVPAARVVAQAPAPTRFPAETREMEGPALFMPGSQGLQLAQPLTQTGDNASERAPHLPPPLLGEREPAPYSLCRPAAARALFSTPPQTSSQHAAPCMAARQPPQPGVAGMLPQVQAPVLGTAETPQQPRRPSTTRASVSPQPTVPRTPKPPPSSSPVPRSTALYPGVQPSPVNARARQAIMAGCLANEAVWEGLIEPSGTAATVQVLPDQGPNSAGCGEAILCRAAPVAAGGAAASPQQRVQTPGAPLLAQGCGVCASVGQASGDDGRGRGGAPTKGSQALVLQGMTQSEQTAVALPAPQQQPPLRQQPPERPPAQQQLLPPQQRQPMPAAALQRHRLQGTEAEQVPPGQASTAGTGEAVEPSSSAEGRPSEQVAASQHLSQAPGVALQALSPEIDWAYWDEGVDVCTSPMPRLAPAYEVAAWANAAGAGRVAQLLSRCSVPNFSSWEARWAFMSKAMTQIMGPEEHAAVATHQTGVEDKHVQQAQQQQQQQQQLQGQQRRLGQVGSESVPITASGVPNTWVRVFSEEYQGRTGWTRRFYVATYQSMWRKVCSLPRLQRHFYEIIPDGTPCHLYFDLEYSRATNPSLDGPRLVSGLVRLVCAAYERLWGLRVQPEWVLELDSSTEEKFSRHVIVRAPGAAFPDVSAVGRFVAHVLNDDSEEARRLNVAAPPLQLQAPRLANAGAASGVPMLQALQGTAAPVANSGTAATTAEAVPAPGLGTAGCSSAGAGGTGDAEDSGRRVSMVDMAVYSRSRAFRLPYCCKGGKVALLLPTQRFISAAARQGGLQLEESHIFLLSLITNVPRGAVALELRPGLANSLAGMRGGSGMPAGWAYDVAEEYEVQLPPLQQPGHPGPAISNLRHVALAALPWVEAAATQRAGGLQAEVRTMIHLPSALVSYSLKGAGSRFCSRMGRSHRSNQVYLVLNFRHGTWYQKCYDPECFAAAYRSQEEDLPYHVWQPDLLASLPQRQLQPQAWPPPAQQQQQQQ